MSLTLNEKYPRVHYRPKYYICVRGQGTHLKLAYVELQAEHVLDVLPPVERLELTQNLLDLLHPHVHLEKGGQFNEYVVLIHAFTWMCVAETKKQTWSSLGHKDSN